MARTKAGRVYILCVAGCLALSFACLVYPVYVIRPFRPQGVRELLAALVVTRFRLPVMVLCAAASLMASIGYWRLGRPRWRRSLVTLGALVVFAFAALSRVNIYELMSHPIEHPAFAAAAQSKLDGEEIVIAVRLGTEARAYPIRILSYHHIANDTLGGVPIAATY
jgi:hypothetical protein